MMTKRYVPGWVGGWMKVKAFIRIAYSNQKQPLKISAAFMAVFKAKSSKY